MSAKKDHLLRLMRLLRQLSHRIGSELSAPLEQQLDLSLKEYQVLLHVAEGARYPSDLTERLALPAPSVSRLLEQLVAQGWLMRSLEKQDMRKLRLDLTEAGHATFEQARETARGAVLERYAHLQEATVERALEALERLWQEMDSVQG